MTLMERQKMVLLLYIVNKEEYGLLTSLFCSFLFFFEFSRLLLED